MIDILLKSAQALVDATHQIIGYDVLITDNEGIIIGANDPGRVGLLHAHSLEIIRRGVAESLDEEQAAAMKVKPGICLPIRLGKRIMGTIGISGAPVEVQKYGHLVQKEAELFLRERALQESSHLRESAVASLVQQIVSYEPKDMNESILHAQGNSLGYDLSLPRIALLVDIRGFGKVVSEVLGEETYGHDAELRVQTIKMMLLKDIRAVFTDPQDLVSNIGSDKYIVLLSVSASSPGRDYGEKVEQGQTRSSRSSPKGDTPSLSASGRSAPPWKSTGTPTRERGKPSPSGRNCGTRPASMTSGTTGWRSFCSR